MKHRGRISPSSYKKLAGARRDATPKLRDIVRKLKINTIIFTGVAEPIAIYGTFLGAWDEGLETVMVADCIIASAIDQKIQDTVHQFSISTFYPMMGARVTESRYLRFE